eukprot:scaffold330869_cov22-Prasinocladus_malaysianus.AAC.1
MPARILQMTAISLRKRDFDICAVAAVIAMSESCSKICRSVVACLLSKEGTFACGRHRPHCLHDCYINA